jgi:hypothetical protein
MTLPSVGDSRAIMRIGIAGQPIGLLAVVFMRLRGQREHAPEELVACA